MSATWSCGAGTVPAAKATQRVDPLPIVRSSSSSDYSAASRSTPRARPPVLRRAVQQAPPQSADVAQVHSCTDQTAESCVRQQSVARNPTASSPQQHTQSRRTAQQPQQPRCNVGGKHSQPAPQQPQQVQSLHKSSPILLPGRKLQSRNRQRTIHFQRPVLEGLVIVEGPNDAKAVWNAAEVEVFWMCGAARTYTEKRLRQLETAMSSHQRIIVLMDPDTAGRQGRSALDRLYGDRMLHAFIPAADAMAMLRIRRKEAGNLGVEHAPPQAVVTALGAARRPQPLRAFFLREHLQPLGLVSEMGSFHRATSDRRAPEMREMVCRLLGIGTCNAKQILKQLNRFGFTEEEVQEAVRLSRLLVFPEETKTD